MIAVPIIFKPQLAKIIAKEANKELNATLDFESIGVNYFESFLNVTVNIKHLRVINKAPFEGETLACLSPFN